MKYRITIPEPCHEDWNKMTPTERGRHCAACQKNVVDFTTYSSRQLFAEISAGKNICGRFHQDQLNRLIYEQPTKKSGVFQLALTSVLALLAANNSKANHPETIVLATSEKIINPEIIKEPAPQTDTLTISGDVVLSSGLPPNTSLQVIILELPYETYTDKNGHFKIFVREKIQLDSITLIFYPWASKPQEMRVSTKSLYARKPLKVVVNNLHDTFYVTGAMAVEDEKGYNVCQNTIVLPQNEPKEKPVRAAFWQRVGSWFR